ncbi:MAG: GspE/PulE family protein [Patescibacteria group bacterium]|jgi:type IV pilus assembly protein PilB
MTSIPSQDVQRIVDTLVAEKHIEAGVLSGIQQEADAQKKNILQMLLAKNVVTEEDVTRTRSQFIGIPYVDLFGKVISQQILNLIPRTLAENYQMIVFSRNAEELHVGMVDPANFKALEALEFLARKNNFRIKTYLISLVGFKQILRQYASLSAEVEEALEASDQKEEDRKESDAEEEDKGFEEVVKTAPVSKMVSVILRHAVEGNASDIHIEPVENETRIRYRIDGILHTSIVLPKYVHASIVARIKVLSNLKLDETRIPQDGRFRTDFEGRSIDYRVSTLPLISNEKVVMRILDRSSIVLDLEKLGFIGKSLEVMKKSVDKSVGMILMTGPTGSGKSTTLSALLTIVNDESVNIVTLEDPVEYYIDGVNQSQVKPEVGLTFASGLRAILRQDPDIVMVGEIRDTETAELGVHAALTGHLVFTTLHTNDAFGAIPRLIDMKIEPFLIASSLSLVAAQRLVRKICPHCKQEMKVPPSLEEYAYSRIKDVPKDKLPEGVGVHRPLVFYQGKGCSRCENTGFKGRLVITEVLEVTEKIKKIITAGSDVDTIKAEALAQGMFTMEQDGIFKSLAGMTTLEEVVRVTKE